MAGLVAGVRGGKLDGDPSPIVLSMKELPDFVAVSCECRHGRREHLLPYKEAKDCG